MTRMVLGEHARSEIRDAIKRCRTSKEIAAEVGRLSSHFGVSRQRIYEVTEDLRPRRKTRSDRGRRLVDLKTDADLRLVAGWVCEYGMNPADAIITARDRGLNVPIEFPTLNRYLREAGLDKKRRRSPEVPHRRFEASAPGEMFQFDISGLKQRWFDPSTRKIISVSSLEVSKNHPNDRPDRVRVWRFVLIDDFSRRIFLRYVGVEKPNSSHVVDFLLQAYAEMGVPLKLYTDNDKIIKFGRNARTTEILNKILLAQGGYENAFHLPGNSRATGKVERAHQSIEVCEKVIGQYIAERGGLTLESLNQRFAPGVMHKINNSVHSETGQTPASRWESHFSVIRRLDYESLRSAFMVDEFLVRLRGDLTIRIKGSSYQLPSGDLYPFANWTGHKLRVVFPDGQDFFTVVGLDGLEYDVVKQAAGADVAGEFRSTRETDAERLRKEVRALAREDAKRLKAEHSAAEPIRYFDDVPAEIPETNVSRFPKPETVVPGDLIAEVAPGRTVAAHDPAIHFWEAVARFEDRFASKSECKSFMDSLFASRDEECWLLLSEVGSAVDSRRPAAGTIRLLKAV